MPDSFEAHYQVASLILSTGGDPQVAHQYAHRAYELSPAGDTRATLHELLAQVAGGDVERCMTYAALDGNRGDFPLALDWIERALAVPNAWRDDPLRSTKLAQVHHARGRYLEGIGRPELARDSYRTAIATEPDHFWAHHNLAMVLFRAHEPRSAVAEIADRALELLPRAGIRTDIIGAVRATLSALSAGKEPGPTPVGPALPEELRGGPK